MQGIADLITERAEEYDVQMAKAKKLTPDDVEWEKQKGTIDLLPREWREYVRKIIKEYPFSAKKYTGHNKNKEQKTQSVIKIPNMKFETELVISEEEGHATKAYYIAFNNTKNQCYMRYLSTTY